MSQEHIRAALALNYIEKVELSSRKPDLEIAHEDCMGEQMDIEGLPGVAFGGASDAAGPWMSVERMAKTGAPMLPPELEGFATVSDNPAREPILMELDEKMDGELSSRIKQSFLEYELGTWLDWSKSELARRESIRLYQKLFAQAMGDDGDSVGEPIDLLWGMGMSSWKSGGSSMRYPFATQSCMVKVDKESSRVEVWPKGEDPAVELDAYREMGALGCAQIERSWSELMAKADVEGVVIHPLNVGSFASAMAEAASLINDKAEFNPSATAPKPAGPAPSLSGGWVLFLRKKTNHFLLADLARLGQAIERDKAAGVELPGALRALVSEADAEIKARQPVAFRGMSSGSSDSMASNLYFPLPYNDEQARIIQELEHSDGVVVQGPPGTGKTHTIANVIAHYMAQGKRVLVTSKGESALSVVKEKLPDGLRQLCVALLTDEAQSAREFEESIALVVGEVAKMDPDKARREIKALDAGIDAAHSKLARIDDSMEKLNAIQSDPAPWQGAMLDLAAKVELARAGRERYGWMEHASLDAQPSGVEDKWLSDMARSKRALGADHLQFALGLPSSGSLPSTSSLALMLAVVGDGVAASAQVDAELGAGRVQKWMKNPVVREKLAELAARAKQASSLSPTGKGGQSSAWMAGFDKDWDAGAPAAKALMALEPRATAAMGERADLLGAAIDVPAQALLDDRYAQLANRLGRSEKPYGFFEKDKSLFKSWMSETRVGGSTPSADGWVKVSRYVGLAKDALGLSRSWSELLQEWNGEALAWDAARPSLAAKAVHESLQALKSRREGRLARRQVAALADELGEPAFARMESSLASELAKACAAGIDGLKAQGELDRLDLLLGSCASDAAGSLSKSLAGARSGHAGWEARWEKSRSDLARLEERAPLWAAVVSASSALSRAGHPRWAKLAEQADPADKDFEEVCGALWKDAWGWRALCNQIDAAPGSERMRELMDDRKEAELELGRLSREAVIKRAWLGIQANCPPLAQQKLQTYLNSVQSMGKGSGARAERHRKTARKAMEDGHRAISCWIMPHWRVSETMVSELGLFDLVIVDEASQSDIWALPALMRGKKVLIVGDHKQVSPSAVGVAEEEMRAHQRDYLAAQPHGAQMAQDKSIYDLGRVAFAANNVMLREHFRSDPAIIEFSNKNFYHGKIRPLRSPERGQGVAAPLVDMRVQGGFRDARDGNPAEARAIVDEIKALIADPAWEGKSIGVVSLLGQHQHKLIAAMLAEEIDPSELLRRKIKSGTPAEFQGRERDVMFMSMVIEKGDLGMSLKQDNEQRLNVAMSRARDRVYLVRSVDSSDVKAESLSGRLMSHFDAPFAADPGSGGRELCESGFEMDMFDELASKGYRVQPQFPCGGYRMDFVALGRDGQKVAIECDGDRFHGPEQWADDMRRQRVLERAGWVFFRCFASSFAKDRSAVMASLEAFLSASGVEPSHGQSGASAVLVERRSVEPLIASKSS